jgi:hypothetical protein
MGYFPDQTLIDATYEYSVSFLTLMGLLLFDTVLVCLWCLYYQSSLMEEKQ